MTNLAHTDVKERIQWFAAKYANAHDIFYIGRGLDYAVSLEGSLKMKEICYIKYALKARMIIGCVNVNVRNGASVRRMTT